MLEAHQGDIPLKSLRPGLSSVTEFKDFINDVYALGASDIKIQSNDFVWADINRVWRKVSDRRLESGEVERALTYVNDPSAIGLIGSGKPVDDRVDLALSAENINEFRLNATGCMVAGARDGLSITMRAIPKEIPSLERLGIEREIMDNLFPRYGLILVVGTTGSGKSTLLSSSLRHRLVNRRHDPVAIGTFEDPIEYGLKGLAEGSMPEPTQMAIGQGRHIQHFDMVGPNAMRRRFDVIVAGEIRDLASARAGMELSRTGHSVLATLHVDTPGESFDRLIKFYPVEQQQGEAFAILSQLRLVIAQKLARTTDGGKIAFRSFVVVDRALREHLGGHPPARWSAMVTKVVAANGNDFETGAYTALKEGRISGETFREVAGFTMEEGVAYVAERGGDVAAVG